jgi:hypothetical protein
MTHSDKRDVDPRDGHFAIGVSILLLALAVFGWGLHSKLSLYHIGARASATAPLAKLLSERERPADTAKHCDLNQGDIHAVARAASAMLIPRPVKQARVIQRRGDVPPLPPGTLARKGPALRRPPPSLVA